MPDSYRINKLLVTLPQDSKERKSFPIFDGFFKYFPAACAWASKVSLIGNDKHNKGEPLHHARGKSADHKDCILRHLIDAEEDAGYGKGLDENGLPHVVMAFWRAGANCQEWLEDNGYAPLAPGAKNEGTNKEK